MNPLLSSAKAFLCWEAFEKLSIQLVSLQSAVAYFYPPHTDYPSIVLFYDPKAKDFSEPLHLLFHEAGHAKQWLHFAAIGTPELFHLRLNLDRGEEKVAFEKEAWDFGRELFVAFLAKEQLVVEDYLPSFDVYAGHCLQSYRD